MWWYSKLPVEQAKMRERVRCAQYDKEWVFYCAIHSLPKSELPSGKSICRLCNSIACKKRYKEARSDPKEYERILDRNRRQKRYRPYLLTRRQGVWYDGGV